ncbi:MAG: hypothetical protein ACRC20_12800 [Segniliparus sp.]|uniref:hypothetical protein n=1 Tax=Segniliparus sp. TaxID=2804064 RepID=UPI003F2F5067
MAGADYLAMVSDPEELLSVARSIDGSKISQLLGEYQQMTQAMTAVGQFGHDVDNAASSQLFGKFVDEAHHESTVLSYAALNIADTCNRMKAKLSNFYEQYVERVQPAAQALQQAYDAQLGQGGVGSPAELRTASTALAKALSHLYTDLAGNPTINVAPTFPEAAIPDIGADGRRAKGGAANGAPKPSDPTSAAAPEQSSPATQASGTAGAGSRQPSGGQAGAGPAGGGAADTGAGQAGGGAGGAGAGGAQGTADALGQGGAGQTSAGQNGAGQDNPASALGGVLGALGQMGSAAGSGLAGAAGAVAGAAGTGAGVASGAVGLGASLGSLAAQPASADKPAPDGLADSGDEAADKVGDGLDSAESAATRPAADLSSGGGFSGGAPHALPEARTGPVPELRPAPAAAGSLVEVSAGGSAAASNGMMGMPMMGGAGMNGAGGEHRVASYLISKEQGERQFTAGLPLASEEILGALDERERLAMQIASIDDPGGEPR